MASTEFIKNGIPVDRDQIAPGSTIAVVVYTPQHDVNNGQLSTIVALPLSVEAYSNAGVGISLVQPCMDNSVDLCHSHVSEAEFYTYIPDADAPSTFPPPVIQYEERVKSIQGDTLTFTTTSGHTLTAELPQGTIASYDKGSKPNLQLGVDDLIDVVSGKADMVIPTKSISYAYIVTEIDYKTGLINKY